MTVSSAAQPRTVTGWKTGWAPAPAALPEAVVRARQSMSDVGATPFQPAVAHALNHESAWSRDMVAALATARGILVAGLRSAGLQVHDASGICFVVADIAPTGHDGLRFYLDLPGRIGVPAIPGQGFCDDPEPRRTKVRVAFGKRHDTLHRAAERLQLVDGHH